MMKGPYVYFYNITIWHIIARLLLTNRIKQYPVTLQVNTDNNVMYQFTLITIMIQLFVFECLSKGDKAEV